MRADKGLSMQQAADEIGISKQYYAMIEAGQRQRKMDFSIAAKIAILYGVTLDYVWEQEEELLASEAAAATAKEESA